MIRLFAGCREKATPGTLLSAHLFLSVASIVLAKAARDAIFLTRYSAQQMIAADLAAVAVTALVVGLQLRLSARVSTRRLLLVSPLCFALGDLGLWLGLSMSTSGLLVWVAHLWIGVQACVGGTQASLLAYQVLTIRQAKRLCGVIGAGSIVGWIGGGLLARTLANQFGAQSLLLGSAVLLACCSVVVSCAWNGPTPQTAAADAPHALPCLKRSASIVWASPHLRAIACLMLASSAVTTIVGFQFREAASRSIGTSGHLAAFLGSFSVYAGLVALTTQVLLTRRILGSLGVGIALLIAPAALAAGSLGILFSGTLAAAVLLKGSDQVLRYSVDRAATDFLYRPLSQEENLQTKTFIDALVCRLGDALGGAIALVWAGALRLGFARLGAISLALLLFWLASAIFAHRYYRDRLRENLRVTPIAADTLSTLAARSWQRVRWHRRPLRQRDLLRGDPAARLDTLRSLTTARERRPNLVLDQQLLATALAAEIVGAALLIDTWSRFEDRLGSQAQIAAAVERIARLLHLVSPDRYPESIRCALSSGTAKTTAAVLEYLDSTLPSPHRELLVGLLEQRIAA